MQEVFEKLKQRIRICATEACGYTPLTRVVSEAELKEIIEQIEDEYSNGHFGCNTNGEHERCDGCGLTNCKSRNKIWFGAVGDGTDTNVGSNGWIPVSERLPDEAFGCLVTVMDCEASTKTEFENILPYFVGYDGETWNDADGEEIPFEVIAWQPLPEPYQPKGE